jgi:hypothetical protein
MTDNHTATPPMQAILPVRKYRRVAVRALRSRILKALASFGQLTVGELVRVIYVGRLRNRSDQRIAAIQASATRRAIARLRAEGIVAVTGHFGRHKLYGSTNRTSHLSLGGEID